MIARFSAGDIDGSLELYADDAVVSQEFALPGPVTAEKAVLAASLEAWRGDPPRMYAEIEVRDLMIHETADPNVVIAEWTYISRVHGVAVRNGNIIVVECRDGKIVRARDYHNHATRAVADGTVPSFVELLESMILPQDDR
ncbi:MAG TPA: nuclear transport factor 2 family protein [Phenylobacterium sp.]|uniref:nuclear transport factor 2 family protein n=1 Tax=Phenylobacterium sp. TaxID=1871053 RepID=UPI002B48CCEA|nr:nuclear transport factor 2 family protein [Phenylobacterium sp.]HKR88805.1 nuclear transport factor 2 family protein [Phenylobacterium sp.]